MGNVLAREILKAVDERVSRIQPPRKVKLDLEGLIHKHHPDNRITPAFCTRDLPQIEQLKRTIYDLSCAFKSYLEKME